MKDINYSFLQSEEWLKTKQELGNECVKFKGGFFTITKVPFFNFKIGYLPRVDLLNIDLKSLLKSAKDSSIIYLTLEPLNLKSNLNSYKFLQENNFLVKSSTPIHLQKTVLIECNQNSETFFANMKQKTRYNSKLSLKKDLEFSIDALDSSFNEFLNLYNLTVKRQKYFGRDLNYIRTVFSNFKKSNSVLIANVKYNNVVLVSWFIIKYKNSLTYVYGGSLDEYKNLMAPYFMVYKLFEFAKENKYDFIDLFGIKNDLSDGYSRFKVGFGGEIIEYANTVDIVFKPILYKLIKLVYFIRNKVLFKN